ncbi:MAG TPA: mandelate racemase/muconate lactonizing enzyme family protein [Armatimonadota bacterium]|nr:mandelate racemase/muconate lactonizing enzyme family protein [Armatimonadota bacterium]
MKIRDIRIIPLFGAPFEGDWPERLSTEESQHALVELTTDEGLTGLGSVYTSAQLVDGAAALLRPLIVGASAVDPATVAEKLRQNTFWQGRGGAITHTISGIDIALWDLFGKITGQPVSRLLGGRFRDHIKPYGSLLMAEPTVMRERLQAAMGRGFRAFKIGWGPFGHEDHAHDEAIVAAAREAVGPDVELMVDAGASDAFWPHGYKWALRTAQMLSGYGAAWFEEPLRPDDLDGYVKLTEHSPVPVAAGEVLTRRQAFIPWIERRAVDYIQPDVTKVGGISEQHRIGQYADDHSIMMISHGWNTAVGLAADLQLAAAAGNARWVEYMTPAPYIDPLLLDQPSLDVEGFLSIPDGPGLGFRWNPDGVARLSRGIELTPQ